jgi:ribosomal protein S18 acetylase RimI-like enzyme
MFSFRTANPSDIPLIREITQKVWPPTYTHIIGQQQINYMIEKFYSDSVIEDQMLGGHQFLIFFNDGLPMAFAGYSPIEPAVFKLHKLYILPSFQGQGFGRTIMEIIIADLKKKKVGELRLNVNRFNYPAIAFYEKNGFKSLKEEDIDIGGGYFMNDFIMVKIIPQSEKVD